MEEVVVDSNKRSLVVTLVDENNVPVNLTGGSAKLQGKSDDIATTIDYPGTLTDPAQGIVTFAEIGALITAANLGALKKATYNLRVKFTDGSAKFDYTRKFQIDWVEKPV